MPRVRRMPPEELRRRHATRPRGEAVYCSKLTARQIVEIREAAGAGASERALAAAYGVCRAAIHKVLSRRSWAHVAD